MAEKEVLTADAIQELEDAFNAAIDSISGSGASEPRVKEMVFAEAFTASNVSVSENGNISSADLVWADGLEGAINSLEEDAGGRIVNLTFHRPNSKSVQMAIDYTGSVPEITLTAQGF